MIVKMQESFCDYPDCSLFGMVLFTEGCNFDCKYCSNFELKHIGKFDILSNDYIFKYLNYGIVECITITGGEPVLHGNKLLEFLKILDNKYPNILVKLDTNGAFPDIIHDIIDKDLIDCIAIDIKSDFQKYETVVGKKFDVSLLIRTIRDCLYSKKIKTVIRTTLIDSFVTSSGFELILDEFIDLWDSSRHVYHLQQFIPNIAEEKIYHRMSNIAMSCIKDILSEYNINFEVLD